jgi:hypothetical protein
LVWISPGISPISSREERPVARDLEAPGSARHGSGEGAALVPEELALDERRREGRTIDVHEGRGRAQREVVDRPRGGGLPGARLAHEQDGRVAGGGPRDPRAQQRRSQAGPHETGRPPRGSDAGGFEHLVREADPARGPVDDRDALEVRDGGGRGEVVVRDEPHEQRLRQLLSRGEKALAKGGRRGAADDAEANLAGPGRRSELAGRDRHALAPVARRGLARRAQHRIDVAENDGRRGGHGEARPTRWRRREAVPRDPSRAHARGVSTPSRPTSADPIAALLWADSRRAARRRFGNFQESAALNDVQRGAAAPRGHR